MVKESYRPDIDGLRALAVLLVVACHLRIKLFAGGYVGVDVFFVISGFLISSIILPQITSSSFSLSIFYQRRIRRIFPALAGMMFITYILAISFLLPTELEDFARSMLAAVFSVSNVYFWTQSGYFDAPAASKPLLHTWSLGVEEQFYLVFPLLLMLLVRTFPKRLRSAIVVLACASFIVSATEAFHAPTSAFYLAHSRAWELLLGALSSMRLFPATRKRYTRELTAAAGLLLIVFSGMLYRTSTPFPGVSALAPCLGAIAIIEAGRSGRSTVGRLLSLKPIVFIGLISYSVYLWHWPVIVFEGITDFIPGSIRQVQVGELAASLILGYLSWKWIEEPFRSGCFKLSGRSLFAPASCIAVCISGAAVSALWFQGFPKRFSPEAIRVGAYLAYKPQYREGTCFVTSKRSTGTYNLSACLKLEESKRNFLLIGDSHAAQLWFGLANVLKDVNIMQATASGCRPLLHSVGEFQCTNLMNFVYEKYLPTHHVDELLIAARWQESDIEGLGESIAWAKRNHVPVILFGPIVEYDSALPRLLVASLTRNDPFLPSRHRVRDPIELDSEMKMLSATSWNVPYISYFTALCNGPSCIDSTDSGIPLQYDVAHLTDEGSVFSVKRFESSGQLP